MQILRRGIVIAGALLAVLGAATPMATAAGKTPARFVDNGDGTVTDTTTNLTWEKKTDADFKDTYTWSLAANDGDPDGTLFSVFLPRMQCTVSADGTCGLAGHYDWRIPNIGELQSIVDCTKPNCIDPIFGPTFPGNFWSTTAALSPSLANWVVDFNSGGPITANRGNLFIVRAVRGGK